jgi:hypothetical protein
VEPLVHPSLARALVRWQHAAGPYWAYVCAAPFLAEHAQPPLADPPRADTRLLSLLRTHSEDGAAAFVDLPPARSLQSAIALNWSGRLVVPAMQRWSVEDALLPSKSLTRLLLTLSMRLSRPGRVHGTVFYMDGDRGRRLRPASSPSGAIKRFDNRFVQSLNVLPTAEFLAEHGVARVAWIMRGRVAADAQHYLRDLRSAGLPVSVVDAG